MATTLQKLSQKINEKSYLEAKEKWASKVSIMDSFLGRQFLSTDEARLLIAAIEAGEADHEPPKSFVELQKEKLIKKITNIEL